MSESGEIISGFEESLSLFPALVAFIPMLMDTGGNSGGQASVTIIRGLALGEIRMRDILRIIWKEIRVGLLCGIVLCACNFLKIILIDNLLLGNHVSMEQAFIVSITLLATVVVAKFVGGTLPVLAKKIGLVTPQAAMIYGGLMGTTSGTAAGLAATDASLVPYGAMTATFYTGLGCLLCPSVLYPLTTLFLK